MIKLQDEQHALDGSELERVSGFVRLYERRNSLKAKPIEIDEQAIDTLNSRLQDSQLDIDMINCNEALK